MDHDLQFMSWYVYVHLNITYTSSDFDNFWLVLLLHMTTPSELRLIIHQTVTGDRASYEVRGTLGENKDFLEEH